MSKTLQGKYADKLNKQIEELYKVIDNKDKIINEQVLEIANSKEKIDKSIELINEIKHYRLDELVLEEYFKELLEILGDKENE